MPHPILSLSLVVAASFGSCASAAAAITAYWRHEDGGPGSLIPAGSGTVFDSSGVGNNMRTFDPAFTSGSYTSSVSPVPLRSGLANTLSIDFGPGGDDAGLNDDNYTDGAPINGQAFFALTVELAFNMNAVAGYQALFGKDGKPLATSPVPPLKFLVRGDDFPGAIPNQLFVEFIDGDGDIHFVSSRTTITAGQWNHVAFTLTPTGAELWMATETEPYVLLDSIVGDFAGPNGDVLFPVFAPFTIGRGMFNGGVADWSDALIDEVRVSDTYLAPGEFLFVPEPASAALLILGSLAACACRPRAQRPS